MDETKELVKAFFEPVLRLAVRNGKDEEKKEDVKNEDVDKRKLIDEIGGILKDKVDDEIIRTIIKKCEELSYNKSEAGTADNKKAKNEDEDDEEVEEEFEQEKEIAENKKAKNDEKEEEKEEAQNKCKNSMDEVKKAVYGGQTKVKTYVSQADRIELGNQY